MRHWQRLDRRALVACLLVAGTAVCHLARAAETAAHAPMPTTASLLQATAQIEGWAWRGVGDPLVLDQAVVVFGIDDKTQKPVARRLDWAAGGRVTDVLLDGLRLDKELRYSAAANSAGIWLAGPSLALLRPNGQLVQAPPGLLRVQQPPIVALPDGSALIFKSVEAAQEAPSHILRARLSADGRRLEVQRVALLSYDGRPNTAGRNYSEPIYGHGAQLLADGRVLMFGDDRTPRLASIFDPATSSMTPVAPMPNDRAVAGSLRLDDGRVVVAGARRLSCYQTSGRKVDLYDVGRNSWASLPDLPLPLCADAPSAWAPSLVQASDGSLVLGGGLEPELLVLARDPNGPLGFASHWRRVGWLAKDRIGGRLQALPGARVAVVGGVHAPDGGAPCCERTPGVDVIDLKAAEAPFAPGGLTFNGPGVAQRGQRLFIAGGRRFQMTGTGQMRFASHAEVLDLRSGVRTQLPAVPVVAGALDAFWIDDDRVIVKGILARSDRGFDSGLASYMPAGTDKLAIFSFSTNRWTTLSLADVRAARLLGVVRLAGRSEPAAVIAAADGLRLLMLGQRAGDTPRLQRWSGRVDAAVGTSRILADNRLVIGTELAASDSVSVLDADCENNGDPHQVQPGCPETFVDMGLPQPANALQIVSLDDPTASPQRIVGPPPDGLVRHAVTATGDVVQLAWQEPMDAAGKVKPGVTKGWALRRWKAGAKPTPTPTWDTLPVPPTWTRSEQGLGERECGSGVFTQSDSSMRCQLLALDDPRDPGGMSSLIFLRTTHANHDWAWNGRAPSAEFATSSVLWYDEAGRRWVEVLKMNGQEARHLPQTLKGLPGKPLRSIGWHLDRPVLWTE